MDKLFFLQISVSTGNADKFCFFPLPSMSLPQASSPAPIWSRRARLARGMKSATPETAAIASATAPQPTTLREICLGYTCYENKRAHWYIYIPSTTDLGLGKVIQVTGNSWIGFGFQVKTNFSIRTKRSENEHCIRLGYVTPDLVVDDYTPDAECAADIRSHPVDKIEEVAYNLGLPIQNPMLLYHHQMIPFGTLPTQISSGARIGSGSWFGLWLMNTITCLQMPLLPSIVQQVSVSKN
ncbi:hypothetical protein GALMADRAFT_764225 [Galerina marginata CBS 339.88]|uniref:Uncharacterized protein n=1 Tax=Galerina marginata (strain CBS 339.88) TaxID=685588 RepID=A0A067SYH1_GALM3|nr:hypothetical protein GALMADRAFT_764225 [Galerina marginata CBS 339.88]